MEFRAVLDPAECRVVYYLSNLTFLKMTPKQTQINTLLRLRDPKIPLFIEIITILETKNGTFTTINILGF
jgi:hypothetical protein